MRLLFLASFAFLAALAAKDAISRAASLMATVPSAKELLQEQITVKSVETGQYCTVLRRGERMCDWRMVLVTDGQREIRMFLAPLLDANDGRYALLQAGDELNVGLRGDVAYTITRTASPAPLPGLPRTATLLDMVQLKAWHKSLLWRDGGRLLADILVLALAYVMIKRMRFPSRALVLYLLCAVLVSAVSVWSLRPRPMPALRSLVDQPVTVAAFGEKLSCRSGWLSTHRRCEPQSFIADTEGRIWPLAYSDTVMLPIERGQDVLLGTHEGFIYRIKPPIQSKKAQGTCSFRDHPTASQRKVVWMCDDEAERLVRQRDFVGQFVARIDRGRMKRELLQFDWTQAAYNEQERKHRHRMFIGAYIPLIGWFLIFVLFSYGRSDQD